ncbi:hypothetical protein [Stenotrophomonas sp. 24(2023)]|uniref:hypothetical protein n=1 Tax=Stenotrophomonas sp. 24(2023) TaxID=3068324 RepID=UPI0027DEE1EF|nr:hypothetical protein [Stenotrophomonas sp. 24(2023)]WMJ70350.1 hypothetical protein Q9R17_04385 [Stenotrophomonas sp. 24(2023)]
MDDYSVFGRPHTRREKFWYWFDHFNWFGAFVLTTLALAAYVLWAAVHAPVPRIRPEAADLQVRMVAETIVQRAVAVRAASLPAGRPYQTTAQIRASAERTVRVRQVLAEPAVLALEARLYADIADHIRAAGDCRPHSCAEVRGRIALLRNARRICMQTHAALQEVLELPVEAAVSLDGQRGRLASGWADSFQDAHFHAEVLRDLQQVHAGIVLSYPRRDPVIAATQVLLGRRS